MNTRLLFLAAILLPLFGCENETPPPPSDNRNDANEQPEQDDTPEVESLNPTIVGFQGVPSGPKWLFVGRVECQGEVEGLIVELGGELEGHTVTVEADGNFTYSVELPPETTGIATAQVTDSEGRVSNKEGWPFPQQ